MSRQQRTGAWLWASIAQYFVMLLVVRSAWTLPYDPLTHAISDLGAVRCGQFSGRAVCSPWHPAANTSWVLTGAALATGAVLTRRVFGQGRTARTGVVLLVLSGLGEISVGLHPEDVSVWHVPSAAVAIGCGLPGILLLGRSLRRRPGHRVVALAGMAMGSIGMAALVVLIAFPGHLFGLVERVAAYPILLWCLLCGVSLLRRPVPDD